MRMGSSTFAAIAAAAAAVGAAGGGLSWASLPDKIRASKGHALCHSCKGKVQLGSTFGRCGVCRGAGVVPKRKFR